MENDSDSRNTENPGEHLGKTDAFIAGVANTDMLMDVPVVLTVEMGRTQMTIRHLLSLIPGSVVTFDRSVTDPMDVLVNGVLVGRGEIVSKDGHLGLRLTEVVSAKERLG
tara:strand:- start:486 stop:815 length:330 start_codon:yes stop_codon:yes gene_type:complete